MAHYLKKDGVVQPIGGVLQSLSAEHITYDNTASGLTADNAQDALDEIVEALPTDVWSSVVSCVTGDTTCTITNSAIATTSRIEIFPQTVSGKFPSVTQAVATAGQVVLTFDALEEATDFQAHIYNLS